jgi:hypothetical protein
MRLAVLACALLAACTAGVAPSTVSTVPTPGSTSPPGSGQGILPHSRPATSSTANPPTAQASTWPVPDDTLTPGAVKPGCTYPVPAGRNVTSTTRAQVFAVYHYTGPTDLAHVELDHRVPHSLCGTDDARNLWPEPYDGAPVSTYVHNMKDRLEALIASKVRYGSMTLAAAQALFEGDWRKAFCTYVTHPGVDCTGE